MPKEDDLKRRNSLTLVLDCYENTAVWLAFLNPVQYNKSHQEGNGAVTSLPSNQSREDGSAMTTTNDTIYNIQSQDTRKSYPQNWPAYNSAQTSEKNAFMVLLADLCANVEQPLHTNGRPRLPLADMVYTGALKTYVGFSARRFDCDVREAHHQGYIDVAPSFNSVKPLYR